MKKLLVAIVFIIVLITACVPVTTKVASEPPVAYVDSVLPQSITSGDKLTFTGHGTAKTGSVVAFQWRSSEDGILSNAPTFSTSSLSVSRHTIYFKVQNNTGDWSPEVYFFVTVLPSGNTKPVIITFECNPGTVTEGSSAVLNWNVSNAVKVSIDPDIGNVTSTGTRTISPRTSTVFVITAINDAGQVTKETSIKLVNIPRHSIELNTITQENGGVRYDGVTSPYPIAGVKDGPYMWQAFISFDISMIPQNAVIKSASLDLSNHDIQGLPFSSLGGMGIIPMSISRIGSKSYVAPSLGGSVITIYAEPTQPLASGMLINSIQDLVTAKASRLQIRVQFEKYFYTLLQDNYISFNGDKTKLVITYED